MRLDWKRWACEPGVWILAGTATFYAMLVVPYWKPTWDSAMYITLARSIAHGEGYTYMGYAHTKYPPGFPLMLSPIVLLFGKNYLLMRASVVACAVGAVGVTYLWFRRIAGVGIAVAVALITAVSYPLAFEATRILSDVPYMLVSLGALYTAERHRESFGAGWFRWTIVLIVASYFMRMIGFTLVFAFAASILLGHRERPLRARMRRAGIALTVVAVVIGGWMGRNALASHTLPEQLREGLSYEREFVGANPERPVTATRLVAGLGRRLADNLDYYDRLSASVLTGRTATGTALVRWIGIWVILGWLWAMWRRRGTPEFYIPLYMGALLLWPAHEGERFLVPVIPILAYYALLPLFALLEGGTAVAKRFVRSGEDDGARWTRARSLARTVVLLIAVGFSLMWNGPLLIAQVQVEHSIPYYGSDMSDFLGAFAWVDKHLPSDAVLATNRAPYGVLLTGRDTYTVPWVADDAVKLAFLDRYRITDIVANKSTPFLNALIAAYPGRFREIQRIGGTIVYAVETPRPGRP
jgi:4-amino-4-deoxy-L-arabinose transferase-like glycosyltransferase